MRLEQIAVALRPRQGWEAIDLGFRMAAHWARPVWSVWLALYVPVGLGLLWALGDTPWLAALLLWWSKPLFDRFLLQVLSRGVFGEVPSLREALGGWREALSPALAYTLLSRFYDFRRSFTLPVLQLERQTGAPARARRRLLSQRAGVFASTLTLVCLQFEVVVFCGILGLSALLTPQVQLAPESAGNDPLLAGLGSIGEWWEWSDTLIYMAAVTVVEPFYVAAGFALYLNRRVLLEGWDVEVAMRRLAQRQQGGGRNVGGVLLVGVLVLAATLAPAVPLAAAEKGPERVERELSAELEGEVPTVDQEAVLAGPQTDIPMQKAGAEPDIPYVALETPARRAAVDVVSDPLFGAEQKVDRWRPRNRETSAASPTPRSNWLSGFFSVVAELLRVVAWIGLAVLIVALIVLLLRRFEARRAPSPESAPPVTLFGLAIDPASLPPDIPTAARAALAAGQVREALSLLYRGALSQLVHVQGLRIGRGATESDVLGLARAQLPAQPVDFFESLLPAWIETAYAGRLPASERIEALIDAYGRSLPAGAPA